MNRSSIKQASEKYGPFLPPDDGSPFLALRLHRLWQDLSHEQRLMYYTRAAVENNPESLETSQRIPPTYSPLFLSSQPGHASPPSTGVGAPSRAQFQPHGSPDIYNTSGNTPELRSPASLIDDEPNTTSARSRSQSPHGGEEGQSQASHIPRPPNAWILYR